VSIAVLGVCFGWDLVPNPCLSDEIRPLGVNAYQMVTGNDSEEDRRHWDKLFNTKDYVYGKEPSAFLKENLPLLPMGKVLDLAMSEGRNAVFMARKGYSVEGVDLSEVATRKAKRLARENKVSITTVIADLMSYTITPDFYEVILNFDYLQRSLIPQIKAGLKRGGVVICEQYLTDQRLNGDGRYVLRDYLLRKGELKEFFKDFEILYYQESNDGREARARLIARKPFK
jgi:tellurite methyltransferase